MIETIKKKAFSMGAREVGFSKINPPEEFSSLDNAITIVVKLSDAVIETIDEKPTHTYFHHYRSVNTLIDQITLQIGIFLEEKGHKYACVPASQTVDRTAYKGLFSHKIAAVSSGLGFIGKNGLFLSEQFGPRVRLGTVLTDMNLSMGYKTSCEQKDCGSCTVCVNNCPAMALYGKNFNSEHPDEALLDVKCCSDYMKREFELIGRGVVCGICISKCAYRAKQKIF